MKRISSLIIAACSAVMLFAQPSDGGRCLMQVNIPNEFEDHRFSSRTMLYDHKRNSTTLSLTKEESNLESIRTISMARFDEVLSNKQASDQGIEQYDINGQRYYVISWLRGPEAYARHQLVALTVKCDTVYEIAMDCDPKKGDKMTEVFFGIIESTAGVHEDSAMILD